MRCASKRKNVTLLYNKIITQTEMESKIYKKSSKI